MVPSIDGVVTLSMIFESPCTRPELSVIRRHHAPFATGSHDFVLAERESTCVPHGAHRASSIGSPLRLRAIFNNLQPVFACEFENRIHIAWPPREVHNDNGPRPLTEDLPDSSRRNVLRIFVDVSHNGNGSAHKDATRRRNEGTAGHNHLISRTDPKPSESKFQRNGAIGHRNRMPASDGGSELAFKLPAFISRPIANLSGFEDARDGRRFFMLEIRPGSEGFLTYRATAVDCEFCW